METLKEAAKAIAVIMLILAMYAALMIACWFAAGVLLPLYYGEPFAWHRLGFCVVNLLAAGCCLLALNRWGGI